MHWAISYLWYHLASWGLTAPAWDSVSPKSQTTISTLYSCASSSWSVSARQQQHIRDCPDTVDYRKQPGKGEACQIDMAWGSHGNHTLPSTMWVALSNRNLTGYCNTVKGRKIYVHKHLHQRPPSSTVTCPKWVRFSLSKMWGCREQSRTLLSLPTTSLKVLFFKD